MRVLTVVVVVTFEFPVDVNPEAASAIVAYPSSALWAFPFGQYRSGHLYNAR